MILAGRSASLSIYGAILDAFIWDAAAVVADTSGPLLHAEILAREYEIPAALGTKIGTFVLQEGKL